MPNMENITNTQLCVFDRNLVAFSEPYIVDCVLVLEYTVRENLYFMQWRPTWWWYLTSLILMFDIRQNRNKIAILTLTPKGLKIWNEIFYWPTYLDFLTEKLLACWLIGLELIRLACCFPLTLVIEKYPHFWKRENKQKP